MPKRIRAMDQGGKPCTAWRIATKAEAHVISITAMARRRGGRMVLGSTRAAPDSAYFTRV